MKVLQALPFALFAIIAHIPASAQTVVLDEGTFRLRVGGQDVGNETFLIRQNGTGENAVVIATGKVVLDTARSGQVLSVELQMAGPALRIAAYQVNLTGTQKEQIAGRVVGSRFSAKIISAEGEMMREYLASDGAVVADEGVAHHYYFLAQRVGAESARVPIIVPRRSQQVMAQVSSRGNESVTVGGASLPARRLVIAAPSEPERHVWVDARGRVLRVEIPTRNYVAERVSAPK
ncbi:MAG: hypothetical protein WEE89_00535 [Gemmatimonadota bacterium]